MTLKRVLICLGLLALLPSAYAAESGEKAAETSGQTTSESGGTTNDENTAETEAEPDCD
ncbi:hypothetical protein [Solemya pervernicosa gill symbiont]|nr:hypothetical protein [Solemya pervernicosa gill symbiont]